MLKECMDNTANAKDALMDKLEEDLNGLKLWFLKTF